MAFYGSARSLLSRFEPQPEDELRESSDSIDQLTSSVEYIRDFLQLDDDFSDDETDNEDDFEPISIPSRSKPSQFMIAQKQQDDRCSVCFELYAESDGKVLLPCGHAFCADCLRAYLSMTVKENADFKHQVSLLLPAPVTNSVRLVVQTSYGVVCPSYKCTGIICADTIHDIADPDTFDRFDRFCLRQTLDELKSDGHLKLCDVCQNGYIQDNCLCSDPYCRERTLRVRTREERLRHKRWERENAKAHELLGIWMARSNVKCCPNCYKPIEKNMGCNHMYCTQCKKNFDWSSAPSYGTGAHWWRPQAPKGKPPAGDETASSVSSLPAATTATVVAI